MAKLLDVLAFILKKYPHKSELSNARVTKMVYLADWHQAIKNKRQITSINWYFDNYGPYVGDVLAEIQSNSNIFLAESTNNFYGSPKVQLKLIDASYEAQVDPDEEKSILHVIEKSAPLNWKDFINLVYSTYPITSSNRYSNLNLIEKAKEYLADK